jgi:hypothetical protein
MCSTAKNTWYIICLQGEREGRERGRKGEREGERERLIKHLVLNVNSYPHAVHMLKPPSKVEANVFQ